ncbi:MAG: CopG family antitoxin [Candidatus Bipolaricaulia bacterium]
MAKIPELKTRREAREFWDTHDLTDYLEDLEPVAEEIFVRPRSKQKVLSIRIERRLAELLKKLAARKGLATSSLVRSWIMERLQEELKTREQKRGS